MLSPYNLNPVKSRARQRSRASAYRATRSPPEEATADPRDVPYPVTLVRDDTDDAEWVATVDALPGCNARGSTPDEALERVAAAVTAWVETAGREGKEVPEPKSAASYSGRLLLRMPHTLHAELARAAERERVSLNQFITDAERWAGARRTGTPPGGPESCRRSPKERRRPHAGRRARGSRTPSSSRMASSSQSWRSSRSSC